MLTLRRIPTVYQYIYPLSSYQYRLKSRKSNNDESKQKSTQNNEDQRLDFEQKNKKQSIKRNEFYLIYSILNVFYFFLQR